MSADQRGFKTDQPLADACMAAFNPAGGLRYHWNALRLRGRLWAPYTAEVARCLEDWHPAEPELVIVGPSAGWHLPANFLLRFQTVWAIEPDPVARWLLRRRFPGVNFRMVGDDFFTPAGSLPWSANLARLFTMFPDQALLFAHFLGQMIGLHPDAVASEDAAEQLHATRPFLRWKAALAGHLQGRTWASLHDRLSSATLPALAAPLELPAELAAPDLQRLCWPDAPGPVYDHLTGELASDLARRILMWSRRPDMHHVVEAMWTRAPLAN